MLPMEPVEDLDAGYNAIHNFTKSFPSVVVLRPRSSRPLHLAYIKSFTLKVL